MRLCHLAVFYIDGMIFWQLVALTQDHENRLCSQRCQQWLWRIHYTDIPDILTHLKSGFSPHSNPIWFVQLHFCFTHLPATSPHHQAVILNSPQIFLWNRASRVFLSFDQHCCVCSETSSVIEGYRCCQHITIMEQEVSLNCRQLDCVCVPV